VASVALGLAGCGMSRARVEGDAAYATRLNMQLGMAGRGLGHWEPCCNAADGLAHWSFWALG
jgi:hypothetical protein